ncbi:hypothetical protein [Streptomyces sp. CC53]|uniref:hypothetical protein n=1 Tax=Streptomyces sp. CC53 TaxID=1906740 RepID=UPI0009A0C0BB|nr:hypothetical protein [Streptomyces sp. CC53]
MNTTTSDTTAPASTADVRDGRATWAYEMRPIVTAADREAAAALVQDRGLWLARRGHYAPALHVTAFRDHRTEAVGLYEDDDGDEVLVGCLLLHRQPDLRSWAVDDPAPALKVSLAHTAPGRTDRVGWLMTLWLAAYAARIGIDCVYAEAPGRSTVSGGTDGRLLGHLRDLGWDVLGSGRNPDGHRVARLRLAAAPSPGLAALIYCTVPAATRRGLEEDAR